MRSARRVIVTGVLPFCALVGARSSAAQVVRGTVRSRATGAPAAGAVLLLVDGAGATQASTIAAEDGRFTLAAPAAGAYALRTLRIGYQPTTSPVFTLGGDTTMNVELADVPRPMPAIVTREESECHVRPDAALYVGALWEDAKTALLAASITRAQGRYRFDLVDYTRVLDPDTQGLREITFNDAAVYDSHSWSSVPPEALQRDGYVSMATPGQVTFAVPDLTTLLSSYFADAHCFRADPATELSDSLAAIDFAPVPSIRHAEIRGRIWIDRRTRELRSLDFQYVNIAAPDDDTRPAGRVDFARLRTGAWVIADWSVTMPVLHSDHETYLRSYEASRRGRIVNFLTTSDDWIVDAIRVQGGTLRAVWRDSTEIWARPLRTLRVRVASAAELGSPAPRDVVAYLDGTRRAVRVDSTGVAEFDGLLPGPYLIEIGSRDLDVLGWQRPRVQVDLGGDALGPTVVRLDPTVVAARAACGDDAKLVTPSTGLIIGTVTRNGVAVAGRAVRLQWSSGGAGSQVVSRTVRSLGGDGRFLVCGVPRDRPVEIQVAGASAPISTTLGANEIVGVVAVAANQ